MWLSRRIMYENPDPDAATLGVVSIGGENAAVVTDTEKRRARLIAPGGYCWQPDTSEDVLIVKGNELYLTGRLLENPGIETGEVRIFSKGASMTLKNDGKIEISGELHLTGDLYVNGQKMEVP